MICPKCKTRETLGRSPVCGVCKAEELYPTMNPSETNTTINRKLHEAMGKCWHEWVYSKRLGHFECAIEGCGHETLDPLEPNPDYCASISDAFSLVEWMRKEKGAHFEISVDEMFWTALVIDGHNTKTFNHLAQVSDESLPMAISLACLKALGVEP